MNPNLIALVILILVTCGLVYSVYTIGKSRSRLSRIINQLRTDLDNQRYLNLWAANNIISITRAEEPDGYFIVTTNKQKTYNHIALTTAIQNAYDTES